MKCWARVGNRDFAVVVPEAGGRVTLLVDGRPMEVEIEEGAPGIYTLLVDGKPHDLAGSPRPGGYALVVDGIPFDVQIEDERRRRISSAGALKAVAEGKLAVHAPMPGLVARVDVAEGDRVERGARLLVLEAMKMENDIQSPRAGRVEQVRVEKGRAVEQGQLLVVLE